MERGSLRRLGPARSEDIIVEDVCDRPLDLLLCAADRVTRYEKITSAQTMSGRSSLPISLGSR
jgi:hypothetical protein